MMWVRSMLVTIKESAVLPRSRPIGMVGEVK
jgi:hypothetical protein